MIAHTQDHRPIGANHAPFARITLGCMAILRQFINLAMQFIIRSESHPFWGVFVGMGKPGLFRALQLPAFRTCCPTIMHNASSIYYAYVFDFSIRHRLVHLCCTLILFCLVDVLTYYLRGGGHPQCRYLMLNFAKHPKNSPKIPEKSLKISENFWKLAF